jgi:WD40 repeat protein
LVTASADRTARIWDARDGALQLVLRGHEGEVNGAAFSPDGSQVVTGSDDKTARIWDARSGRQIAILGPHKGEVHDAVYSADGALI